MVEIINMIDITVTDMTLEREEARRRDVEVTRRRRCKAEE